MRPRFRALAARSLLFATFASRASLAETGDGAAPVAAEAPSSQWSLRFEAPAECPDAASFRRSVDESAGAIAEGVEVSAAVTRADDAYQLRLTTLVDGRPGQRELTDTDCRALVTTAAAIVVWAVAPAATAESSEVVQDQSTPSEPTSNDTTARAAAASGVPNEATSGEHERKRRSAKDNAQPAERSSASEKRGTEFQSRETAWALRFGAGGVVGRAPTLAPIIDAGADYREGRLALGFVVDVVPPWQTEVEAWSGTFTSVGVTLEACGRFTLSVRSGFLSCATVGSDWLWARVRDIDAQAFDATVRFGAGLGFEWALGKSWWLRPSLALHVLAKQARFRAREADLVVEWWNTPTLGGRGTLDALVFF